MSKIVFKKNAGGVGGEFVLQAERFSESALVGVVENTLLGEVRKGVKQFVFINNYEQAARTFKSQEAAVEFGLIFLRDKIKWGGVND